MVEKLVAVLLVLVVVPRPDGQDIRHSGQWWRSPAGRQADHRADVEFDSGAEARNRHGSVLAEFLVLVELRSVASGFAVHVGERTVVA